MKKPTRNNKVTFNIYRHNVNNPSMSICGVIEYPLVIHRLVSEQLEMDNGERKRFSNKWTVTHLPTGLGCGISGTWDSCKAFVEQLGQHSAFLMVTSDTLTSHPCYSDLLDKYSVFKSKHLVL